MQKFVLGVIFLVSAIFSADNFTFEKVNNPKEVVSKAQKQSLKSKQSSQVRSYTPLPISQFVFDENLDELTSVSSGGQHLFYLAYNKVQNDPTKTFSVNIPEVDTSTGYRCDYNGSHQAICSFKEFYHRVEYANNSIGGWFYFTQYPTSNDNFVLIDRKNTKRGNAGGSQSFMGGKPHFKVFVDTYGKLSVTFTLVTGGTQTVSTPQAIPLNTRVYLQANNSGIDYEVGWTTLDGTSSRASGSHQGFSIPADIDEHRVARNNKTSCQSGPNDIGTPTAKNSGCIKISLKPDVSDTDLANQSAINDAKLELFAKINAMKNFFWNYKIDMFADMNATDISNNTVFQPNTSLVVDTNFINKVYGDLFMGQNNFNANQLRVYIADNYIIADVREY
ncbi:hypothetical protein [Campylobacter hyointestinalis]|uniref:hypothetical protein n=3 Tax=Campylobacter hyointestinalis TaxID=198 RepID=UPI000CE4549F|nr:hypothetical protein [Campylobacter hyointestinalis]PPB71993.1 hypothetical protein CDQ79_07645 [Campylobacter hyointestinalis subsp. hyointestinalis]